MFLDVGFCRVCGGGLVVVDLCIDFGLGCGCCFLVFGVCGFCLVVLGYSGFAGISCVWVCCCRLRLFCCRGRWSTALWYLRFCGVFLGLPVLLVLTFVLRCRFGWLCWVCIVVCLPGGELGGFWFWYCGCLPVWFRWFYFVCGLIVLARFACVGNGLRGGRLASCRCVWCT